MKLIFRLATNLFTLDWYRVRKSPQDVVATKRFPNLGRLRLATYDSRLKLLDSTFRLGVPEDAAIDEKNELGAPLFEQTEYQLYLRAKNIGDQVEIRHRDPALTRALNSQEEGGVVHGTVNFRGQIGYSTFAIHVNGKQVLDFEVEVFPTKIDYQTDYKDILADVQSILTSLAYEYLKSTYQLGKTSGDHQSSTLEWLVLVQHIVDELEQSMNHIAQHPMRGLVRRERTSRLERLRRIDSRIRSQVRRGQGKGQLVTVGELRSREHLTHRPAELTLDTMEHRWLRNKLLAVQRTLSQIEQIYENNPQTSDRRIRAVEGVTALKCRIARLIQLEPIDAADGDPPTGFASLQLVSAPGYREAYRLLMLLQMGLKLEGDLLQLSVKDLEVLYEYWTYLTVVDIVRREHGKPERLDRLFKLNNAGLSVQLKRGSSQQISFKTGKKRKVQVAYNPQFSNQESTLIPQKPDILISLEESGWPIIRLVADAKYRIDTSEEYRNQFQSFGPPKDAINVLHRYRDAILEIDQSELGAQGLQRSVVQAAALFPMNRQPDEDFRDSRLWKSLTKLGIGAIPLLPTNKVLLQEWLLESLRQGGWSLADRVIASNAEQRSRDWRIAASDHVLVGVLRSPGTLDHLNWIKNKRRYYLPWAKTQRRQYAAKKLAIYIPIGLDEPSGIRLEADILNFEIVDRQAIKTPWPARRNEKMMMYHLGSVRSLQNAIEFATGDFMPPQGRWTTRLGFERAQTIGEIALETEPEWRLHEFLNANKIPFKIRLSPPKLQNLDNPKGRAWFTFDFRPSVQIRFDGMNGYLVRRGANVDQYFSVNQLNDIRNLLSPSE